MDGRDAKNPDKISSPIQLAGVYSRLAVSQTCVPLMEEAGPYSAMTETDRLKCAVAFALPWSEYSRQHR